jgi:hypothetical protein
MDPPISRVVLLDLVGLVELGAGRDLRGHRGRDEHLAVVARVAELEVHRGRSRELR